ncbi:MAG: glycosyltransferase family 2 protein [Alphaproteobacteria bacterium]|nr:glycosyltransferase family 2 protein [Alphaproteobacteria bacterium]
MASEHTSANPLLSVVIPMHNEHEMIPLLLPLLKEHLAPLGSYEIICVDDGSRDTTLALLQAAAAANSHVRYLSFSRNFGHQSALKAGIDHARGQAVITMDADLQHPPELLATMVQHWRKGGVEVVQMVRQEADEPPFKRLTSRFFYTLINRIGHCQIARGASDFRLLDRKVVDVLASLPERDLFLRGVIPWLGFSQLNLPYLPSARAAGKTKYSLARMLNLAISGITSVSIRPLRLSCFIGLVMAGVALLYACYALVAHLFLDTVVPGWTSLLAGIMLIGGIQMLMLGLIGEYIGKILVEVKNRPSYIVREQSAGTLLREVSAGY